MKAINFIRDRTSLILLNLVCALLLFIYLSAIGIGKYEVLLILIAWLIILVVYFFVCFSISKQKIDNYIQTMDSLSQKYLFAEIVENKGGSEHQVFFRLMKQSLRSMTEEVSKNRREKESYIEFIEQWAHEIKVPLTSIILTCENNLESNTRKILIQSNQIQDYLEQILYYARLGNVEKDYMIKNVSLEDFVTDSLLQNKYVLIQNQIIIETSKLDIPVYTDKKWLTFIVNQIISNSVRYRTNNPILNISGGESGNFIHLKIKDNGIGIRKSEIGRVFQKGFTGSNGRCRKYSTGIGLYLCKELCDQLGIKIQLESEFGKYTCVTVSFPKCKNFLSLGVNITKM